MANSRTVKYLNLGGEDLRKAILICLLLFCLTIPLAANGDVAGDVATENADTQTVNTLVVNGKNYTFIEPLLNEDGRILVPLRPIFEILGAEVQWDQETKTISSIYDDKEIIIIVDDDTPMIDGICYKIDVPAQIFTSRTYVPLRFLGESLGYDVTWESLSQEVIMNKYPEAQEKVQLTSFEPAPQIKVISSTVGQASWYGKELHGNKTTSGEIFDCYAFTAAHPSLPFGTYLQVTSLKTEKSVIVRVNDRGPNQKIHPNRILDLSLAAAEAIGLKSQGVGQVKVEVLEGVPPEY